MAAIRATEQCIIGIIVFNKHFIICLMENLGLLVIDYIGLKTGIWHLRFSITMQMSPCKRKVNVVHHYLYETLLADFTMRYRHFNIF